MSTVTKLASWALPAGSAAASTPRTARRWGGAGQRQLYFPSPQISEGGSRMKSHSSNLTSFSSIRTKESTIITAPLPSQTHQSNVAASVREYFRVRLTYNLTIREPIYSRLSTSIWFTTQNRLTRKSSLNTPKYPLQQRWRSHDLLLQDLDVGVFGQRQRGSLCPALHAAEFDCNNTQRTTHVCRPSGKNYALALLFCIRCSFLLKIEYHDTVMPNTLYFFLSIKLVNMDFRAFTGFL